MRGDLGQTRQQVGRLGVQSRRESEERLDPNLPAVLFDQVDLRAVKSRSRRQRFLREPQERPPGPNPLADQPHEVACVHRRWRNDRWALRLLNRQSVTQVRQCATVVVAEHADECEWKTT
jgi:hypothetical protein